MHVERIASTGDLAALADQWNALAADHPMRSWDWLATWWKHYGGGRSAAEFRARRRLYVLAVFDGWRLAGVAPWYVDRSLLYGRNLRWLGDGEVCTDHSSLICRREDKYRVAAAVGDALATEFNDWDRLELTAVDADDEVVAALAAALQRGGCDVSRRTASACWIIDLPSNWEDYLSVLSKSHRKQLRQIERRVLDADQAVWHPVATSEDFQTAWPILVDLHQRRRHSLGQPGCFASRAFHDFHREAAERLLTRGQLRLSWLELGGRPAAAEYHLAGGQTIYAYQGGVDPNRLSAEAGRLSTIFCLRAAIASGHRLFDFLRGDEPYKAHWRATARPTIDFCVTPGRRLARWRGNLAAAADVTTDWVRRRAGALREQLSVG
jgi:CelD/BcsL family acetyltransferase involved in cellulose biosynthesis